MRRTAVTGRAPGLPRPHSLALIPLLVALPTAAGANNDQLQVALAPLCEDSRFLQQVTAKASLDLAKAGWQVIDLGDPVSTSCATELDRPLTTLAEAKELFHQLKLKGARTKLQATLTQLGNVNVLAVGLRREALLYLGWIDVENGNLGAAADTFRDILRLWPDWRPSAADVPPAVVEAFTANVAGMGAAPRGILAVRTEPAGAWVTVDGVRRCQTPCEVRDLAQGEHHLQVDDRGRGEHNRWITVPASATVTVEPTLAMPGIRSALLRMAKGDDRSNLEAALMTLAGTTTLLIAPESGSRRPRLFAYRQALVDNELDPDDVLRAAEKVVAAAGKLPGGGPASGPTSPPTGADAAYDGDLTSSWWFWTLVGTAAAIAVAGTGAGIYLYDRNHDQVRIAVTP